MTVEVLKEPPGKGLQYRKDFDTPRPFRSIAFMIHYTP